MKLLDSRKVHLALNKKIGRVKGLHTRPCVVLSIHLNDFRLNFIDCIFDSLEYSLQEMENFTVEEVTDICIKEINDICQNIGKIKI